MTIFDRVKKAHGILQSPKLWPSLINIQKEENQPRAKFKPSLTARDVMASDLCASRTLSRTAKRVVRSTYMWMNNLMVYMHMPTSPEKKIGWKWKKKCYDVNEDADILWFQTVQKLWLYTSRRSQICSECCPGYSATQCSLEKELGSADSVGRSGFSCLSWTIVKGH